jgi:hypothetical protein
MHFVLSVKTQKFLLFFNVVALTAAIIANRNLKSALSGMQAQLSKPPSTTSSNSSDKEGDFLIPTNSNFSTIITLLTNLSRLHMQNIQIKKIEYSADFSSADITIKSYELDDIDLYIKNLDTNFKKDNFYIAQITLDDTQDNEKEPEITVKDNKSPEAIPFALAYLKEQKRRAEAQKGKDKSLDGYKVNIKVML